MIEQFSHASYSKPVVFDDEKDTDATSLFIKNENKRLGKKQRKAEAALSSGGGISRRRLDDHHARVGGQRRFLFENTEAMNEYHDEMHRNVGTFEVGVVFCCVALCLIVALLLSWLFCPFAYICSARCAAGSTVCLAHRFASGDWTVTVRTTSLDSTRRIT